MKKIITIILAAAMLFVLSACKNTNETGTTDVSQSSNNSVTASTNNSTTTDSGTSVTDQTNSDSSAEIRILVLYFSAQTAVEADAISGATPRIDNIAATEYLAKIIHEQVGGELVKIAAVEKYPLGYNETADQAKANADSDKRPAITVDVDPSDYDVIFIGYPIWWYTLPMEMYTFFDTYDFSGKTIIPFNTHAGSRDGGTYETIKDLEPDAVVMDGLAISGESVKDSSDQVNDWLSGLNY